MQHQFAMLLACCAIGLPICGREAMPPGAPRIGAAAVTRKQSKKIMVPATGTRLDRSNVQYPPAHLDIYIHIPACSHKYQEIWHVANSSLP